MLTHFDLDTGVAVAFVQAEMLRSRGRWDRARKKDHG